MSSPLHHIPRLPLTNFPIRKSEAYHHLLYTLAKNHTNEEIYITLAALTLYPIKSIDDVFNDVRDAIKSKARSEGRSEDCVTDELLQAQSLNGVLGRNRAQIREDLFGRLRGWEWDRRLQLQIAKRILGEEEMAESQEGRVKEEEGAEGETLAPGNLLTVAEEDAQRPSREECRSTEASIRESMSLQRILN